MRPAPGDLKDSAFAAIPGAPAYQAFDVRAESRLACQAKVASEDVVVEITEESHRAWLDENPDERKKAHAG